MAMTQGQELALEQLREVAAAAKTLGAAMRLVKVEEPEKDGGPASAEISIYCAELERAPEGLPLQEWEHVLVRIPPDFPFRYPSAWVLHDRFAGFPHVHWKHWLCLYQAPSIEWDPSDGMFGFLDRLDYWLRQGALGQLDPVGAPLHPPITYYTDDPLRTVVARQNAPSVGTQPWLGTAHLRVTSASRVDLVGWSLLDDEDTPTGVAAAILLTGPFPYEFPTKVADLLAALAERGVSHEDFLRTLRWAVDHNGDDAPLYVVIGCPMRGVRGMALRQHLTVWYVEPLYAWGLKTAYDQYTEEEETRTIGERVEKLLQNWASIAKVDWCFVHEDRPELVVRRDYAAPLAWFTGRTVAVWGCGALGGHVAEYLTRAGVKKLVLRDNGIVTPGVLVRQPFDDVDIGRFKVFALRDRLQHIRSSLEVEVSIGDILKDPLGRDNWANGVDVVIDAAASLPVIALLERSLSKWKVRVPIVSMVIGHSAERGMVVVSGPYHSGGPHDVCRRMKLEACERPDLTGFLDDFWPADRQSTFQPEPGCSDATFVGSEADVAALAAMMLNWGVTDLHSPPKGTTATGHFVMQPHVTTPAGQAAGAGFAWKPDRVSNDPHAGYEVRIAPRAWAGIRTWIAESKEAWGAECETGGLLFGERDEAVGVIWVSEVSGPPQDSEQSAVKFVCGIKGTAELNAEKRARTRGSVRYVGMWHTHPDSLPVPSGTDFNGMRRLVEAAGGASRSLMLIVGGLHEDCPMLGTYVFRAADFTIKPGTLVIRPCVMRVVNWD